MDKINKKYLPTDAEIDEFYAGKASCADDIFSCRFFSESSDSGVWRFCLWAPNARSVSIVGDWNEWDSACNPMERHRGLWVAFIKEAKHGDNYKYSIEGADGVFVIKADPYAKHTETPPETASKVWNTDGYEWGDANWMERRAKSNALREPVSIYELHLGSWRKKEGYEYPSIREIADELCEYILETGFTHVELLPINEFPFDGSWGYQVTGFFAVTSRYGTPQDFMYFVDTLHRAGIGVFVDWVPAHFPRDAFGLAHFDGTWLYEHENPIRREHPEWGTYEFNYCRPEVVSFLISSANNLVNLYHIDGIRVDAVSSILYLDYGRDQGIVLNKDGGNVDLEAVDFLKALNVAILGSHPGVISMAEEATAFPLVTKPPYDGGLGFTFKWNMGFMHDTLDFMLSDPYFRHGAHDKMTFSMFYAFSENFILPYSHDEVVHGKKSLIDKMYGEYDEKFSALKTLFGWQFGHPGKKLMFMGDEFAHFIEWDYKKELDWFLLEYDSHRGMLSWVSELNRLYRENAALYSIDDGWAGFKWLTVDDRENSIFAFMRSSENEHVVCIYNFSVADIKKYEVAIPEKGKLRLLLSSEGPKGIKKAVAVHKKELNGLPYTGVFNIPKLSALFYSFTSV